PGGRRGRDARAAPRRLTATRAFLLKGLGALQHARVRPLLRGRLLGVLAARRPAERAAPAFPRRGPGPDRAAPSNQLRRRGRLGPTQPRPVPPGAEAPGERA